MAKVEGRSYANFVKYLEVYHYPLASNDLSLIEKFISDENAGLSAIEKFVDSKTGVSEG